MLGPALSLLLALGPGSASWREVGAPEDGLRFDPPALEPGYDLREDWSDIWRRFEDRNGRPQPRGPLLQPAPHLQGPEYELTVAVARHPMYLERDWASRTRGARLFIHSDDEYRFFNGARLKEFVPMGRVGALGLRYDRLDLREIRSSLFQLEFAFPDIRGTGAFVAIRPIARFEKPDLDIEIAFGWARRGLGRVEGRVFLLDPFNNATDALAQNREAVREERFVQRNPSIGLSGEAGIDVIPSIRVQAFVGSVLPSYTSHYFAAPERPDVRREQWAVLGGGLVEWAIPRTPVRAGATGTIVRTAQIDLDPLARVAATEPERETRARAYMIATLDRESVPHMHGRVDLELVGSYRLTELPFNRGTVARGRVARDRSWFGMVRADWMPTRVFGFELGYLVIDRAAEGTPGEELYMAELLTDTNHRLSTRFALAFDPHVRITFGVGWDLDDRHNRYDQGGMTLTARW